MLDSFCESLLSDALALDPYTYPPEDLCPSCGKPAMYKNMSASRVFRENGGVCIECRKARRFIEVSANSALRIIIPHERRFYRGLSASAKRSQRKEEISTRKSIIPYKLWLIRTLKKIQIEKQKAENMLERLRINADPFGLRECVRCGMIKFLMDFPYNDKRKMYLARVCSECQSNVRKEQKARQYKKDKEARDRRSNVVDPKKLVIPMTDIERRLKNRLYKRKRRPINRKDPIKRIHRNFSEIVRRYMRRFKQNKPVGGWQAIVGYSIVDLKEHLEKQFQPGMSWENYGEWHIDHIIPKSAFDVEHYCDTEFLKCWALDNLQPLWAKDNVKKSNSLVWNPEQV